MNIPSNMPMIIGWMMVGGSAFLFFGPDAVRRRKGKYDLTHIPAIEFLVGVILIGVSVWMKTR